MGWLHGAQNTGPEVCPDTVGMDHSSSLGFFLCFGNELVSFGRSLSCLTESVAFERYKYRPKLSPSPSGSLPSSLCTPLFLLHSQLYHPVELMSHCSRVCKCASCATLHLRCRGK